MTRGRTCDTARRTDGRTRAAATGTARAPGPHRVLSAEREREGQSAVRRCDSDRTAAGRPATDADRRGPTRSRPTQPPSDEPGPGGTGSSHPRYPPLLVKTYTRARSRRGSLPDGLGCVGLRYLPSTAEPPSRLLPQRRRSPGEPGDIHDTQFHPPKGRGRRGRPQPDCFRSASPTGRIAN